MNNDIENISIEEIRAKNAADEIITVEIKDEAKLIIEAHNASSLSHKTLFDSINNKIETIEGTVNEIEENVVLISDVPTKVSDLQNDLGFMNEENLASAVEIMSLVNAQSVDTLVNNVKNQIDNNITTVSNTFLNELNNVESKIPDGSAIVNCAARSAKFIQLTPPASNGTITIPEDGILYTAGKNNVGNIGWFVVNDVLADNIPRLDLNTIALNQVCGFEFLVKKGDILKFNYGCFDFNRMFFYYLNGNAPADEENNSGEGE